MSRPKVYLSGPISGCDWNECTSWRDYVESELKEFKCLSPLRGKSYLKKAGRIGDKTSLQNTPGYKDVLSSDQAIMFRDSHDTFNSDAIFVNLLGTTKVSIGTMFEVAWAFEKRKPIVICMEDTNLHDHPMLRASTPFFVSDIDLGIKLLKLIFAM